MAATVTLPTLLSLFKIDRDLQHLRTGLDNVQKEQKLQQAKIAQLQKEHETQNNAHQKLQADISIRDMDMKTRQEHIEKLRTSLNTTKTNKEYSAILVHISGEKAEVSKIETGLLEQMQLLENLGKVVATLREQIAAEEQTLKTIEAQHAEKVNALTTEINTLSKRRAEAAAHVPAEALRLYDRVSQKYPGDAMAPLEFDESDLDSVSCGSCYMGLNVEHLNALRGRDAIRRCDSCNRILYLADMLAQV